MANDTATKLLDRVKKLREARGLSQEAFAEKTGLGYKYYQHVEAGRRRDIRLSTLEKLAKACGLKLCELLNFDVEPASYSDAKSDSTKHGPTGTPPRPKSKPTKKPPP